jgi:hypothetical protein
MPSTLEVDNRTGQTHRQETPVEVRVYRNDSGASSSTNLFYKAI